MRSLIRLANRKGYLVGDLNPLQEEALQWLIVDELAQESELERERMKYTILAGNTQLWMHLYGNEAEEEDGEIEWIVPESAEEVEQLERILNEIQSGSEVF